MPPSDTTEAIPEEFVSQVRDALVHLYDYAYLVRHPLVEHLVPEDQRTSAGHALRNVILDAIEELHPDASVLRGTRGWRPYDILTQRYVDGFGVDDLLESLHISLRQFQREQRRALLAVTRILWERRIPAQPVSPQPDDLEHVTRLGAEVRRMGLRLEMTDVRGLVDSANRSVLPLARQMDVAMEVRGGPPIAALVDPALARQGLVAALSAVISAGQSGASISWRATAQGVTLLVESALPQERFAAVMERLEPLAELLQSQGARYALESEGETWRLRIDLRGASGTQVLLVDDDQRLRQLYGRYLESEGFSVDGMASAQEALQALDSGAPAVIILDVMMRDMDGWQLLQALRARDDVANTPIIVCSVLNEPDLAMALGAQQYLRKPIAPQELISAVRQALVSWHSA